MRILRRVAAISALSLVGVLVVLGKLGAADPGVALRRTLQQAGYQHASVDLARADAGAAHVVIGYDPQGQSPAAIDVLSRRAAELAWTRGRIEIVAVSVRPRDGAVLERSAEQLRSAGAPPARRQRYAEVDARAGRVVALAVLAVLLTGVLVVCASVAAVSVARRPRRRPQS